MKHVLSGLLVSLMLLVSLAQISMLSSIRDLNGITAGQEGQLSAIARDDVARKRADSVSNNGTPKAQPKAHELFRNPDIYIYSQPDHNNATRNSDLQHSTVLI